MDVVDINKDLVAEQESLDAIVADLTDEQWEKPTPSPGWRIREQIAHLAYFDRTATLAVQDPEAFVESTTALLASLEDGPEAGADLTLDWARPMSAADLLKEWRHGRAELAAAGATLAADDRVPWYGPSMGAKSFLTARLMECWAHGQDIVDTVGATRPATARLAHIARLGFITRGWSYANRGLEAPATPVAVALDAPGGDTWTFGPEDAADRISGPAEDFCLVTTQRRHVDDTALDVVGGAAREWMTLAQAFAGAATDGPPPRA